MIKRRLALLALEGVLLLTACGQTKDISTLTTPPPQSAAQVIAPAGDGAQGGAENSSTVETVEETEPAGGKKNSKPANDAEIPSGKTEETPPTPTGEGQPDVPEQPTTPEQPVMPAPAPTPAEEQEQTVPEVTSEPAPKPAASGNIYSIAEAIQAGNEYAQAQYGVTIDTTMTTADSSYFPGTADSVAWLAANGGQEALNRAVRGNVDATFAFLAAMDGADTVSAYARFNCTVRYNASSDEYIVVVLYG